MEAKYQTGRDAIFYRQSHLRKNSESVSKKSSKVHTMGQPVAEERLKTPYFIAFCIQQVTRISLTSTIKETF
jgi:hypothetical protein